MTQFTYDPASHYDRVTPAWGWLLGDELHYGVFDQGDEPLEVATHALTELLCRTADIEAGDVVLDVGCGTGAPACHLARLGAIVTGITTSPAGVTSAQARAAAEGLTDRATFMVGDGEANGLPESSFDVAWVLESSHLMRDREALMAECGRVLRPAGRLVLCDIMLRREMPLKEVMQRRPQLEVLRWAFGDARMESLETYADRASKSGLEVETELDLTAATRPTFARWRANAERHRDEVLGLLGEEGLAQFIAATELLEGFWDDGTLGYGLLAARRP
jgi:27-O-demethylrifamycin SV methyltransferase